MFQNQNPAISTLNAGSSGGGGGEGTTPNESTQQSPANYNGMSQDPHSNQQHQKTQQQQSGANNSKSVRKKPYVKITEQPAGKALRFRYECEGRSAGSIPGVNSTQENKTYPTIEIVGYKGRAVVVVSCVTKDSPYRPHPHNLVGKEGCKKGVCTLEINSETMRAVFSNLGIQCVKKKDIEAALKAREEIRVDPFKTGFSHRFQPSSIDLNSVRLCFQVFMESERASEKGRFTQPLSPVVSEPIYDKKAMSDLVICRLCSFSASVLGNTQIILLCEKVAKEDITVRFFEEKNGDVWEAYGEFQHTDVHKQTAITFKTPRYHSLDITEPAKVFIQLKRPSDGVTSEPLPFEYIPLDSDPAHLRRKRQKIGGDPMHLLLQQQQKQKQQQKHQHQQQQPLHPNDHQEGHQMSCWNAPNIPSIKTEMKVERETSPQTFAPYRVPPELTPSPQPPSPSNKYNPTPSPYSMAAGGNGNTLLMSPTHQYNTNSAGGVGVGLSDGNNAIAAAAGSPMDMSDYGHFHQQQQQQQLHSQHPQHPHTHAHAPRTQHEQYPHNVFGGSVSPAAAFAAHWAHKFAHEGAATGNSTVAIDGNVGNGKCNGNGNGNVDGSSISNLNTVNTFAMQQLLTGAHAQWNLMPNAMDHHHHHQQQQQQQQHQQQEPQQQQQHPTLMSQHPHQHQPQSQPQSQSQSHAYQQQNAAENNMVALAAQNNPSNNPNSSTNNSNTNNNSNNDNGTSVSTLFTFDSAQYVHIDSADQRLLRLTSEDLQISNLSITT